MMPYDRENQFAPGKLWSLWDIMQRVDFESLAFAYGNLCGFAKAAENVGGYDRLAVHTFSQVQELTTKLVKALRQSGCNLTLKAASEALTILDGAERRDDGFYYFTFYQKGALKGELIDVARQLPRELGSIFLVRVAADHLTLFENDKPFGDLVALNFPVAAYDAEEAGKCLALDRSTASAFHSIRSLEAGIRALSRCLQIPDPTRAGDRNWGKMLKTLKDGIDKRWPTSSDRMSGDGEFFDNSYAALAAIQNPWRNATMHLDQKYTPDEARHIFEVVRGFMSRVAGRMDETGSPLA